MSVTRKFGKFTYDVQSSGDRTAFLDDAFYEAENLSLNGVLIGHEGFGVWVVEGDGTAVNEMVSWMQNDSRVSGVAVTDTETGSAEYQKLYSHWDDDYRKVA